MHTESSIQLLAVFIPSIIWKTNFFYHDTVLEDYKKFFPLEFSVGYQYLGEGCTSYTCSGQCAETCIRDWLFHPDLW
jgi:hypothetical protein